MLQERGRPIQPPKKPEAAPFFLPTVPSLSRRPVFDTAASSTPAPAAENRVLPGWGEGEEHGGLAEGMQTSPQRAVYFYFVTSCQSQLSIYPQIYSR